MQREDREQRNDRERGGGDVDELRVDREQQAAEGGTADHRELKGDRAMGKRPHQDLLRHERRRHRASGGRAEGRGDARAEREREERPRVVRPAPRHGEEAEGDHCVDRYRDREDGTSRVAVREVPGGERQQRQRDEHREPDDPEVERVPVDLVDLPADRDERHLDRERRRHRGGDIEREVAVAKRRAHVVES
jgi:hypothetical protein